MNEHDVYKYSFTIERLVPTMPDVHCTCSFFDFTNEWRPVMDAFATFVADDLSRLRNLRKDVHFCLHFTGQSGVVTLCGIFLYGAMDKSVYPHDELLPWNEALARIDRMLGNEELN